MALDTASMATCWPITRLCSSSSIRIRRCDSASVSLNTGMPVHMETMSAISSSPISAWSASPEDFQFSSISRFFSVSLRSLSRRFAAFSNSCASIDASFSLRTCSISSSSSLCTGGAVISLIRIREAASSIRSIALSGSCRSWM